MSALTLTAIHKSYRQGAAELAILRGVDLTLTAGESVALVGPSGTGKSTLLHIAGLMDTPDSGTLTVAGQTVQTGSDKARTALRQAAIGFVYQFHHLLPEFTALENVMMPQIVAGVGKAAARSRATDLLTRVGLLERLSHRPAELSGGEQQRVALARALANKPAVLLADEPTGNLDPHTAEQVSTLIRDLVQEQNLAALIATHNMAFATTLDRRVTVRDGVLHTAA